MDNGARGRRPARRMVARPEGPASVLAIGTAVPPNVVYQKDYADFYFRVTNSEHQTELKRKFERMCEKSCITKRHLFLTEELLRGNPSLCGYWERSLDVRQDMVVAEVPRLAGAAARAAMAEWGRPRAAITHLVFCTTSGVDMPGADWALLKTLGLRSDVQRVMLYQQGCFGGGAALRVAKDLAENAAGARVLVVCSEITAITFRGPSETHLDSLVGQALFGDGAAAMIVGCLDDDDEDDDDEEEEEDHQPQEEDQDRGQQPRRRRRRRGDGERALFEIHRASSHILPDSDGAIDGHLREVGLTFHLLKDVPSIIGSNIGALMRRVVRAAFKARKGGHDQVLVDLDQGLVDLDQGLVGLDLDLDLDPPSSFDDMFWIVHPGGPAILDQVQERLQLRPHQLAASRAVLDRFGNMSSACVHFILDHMRRSSAERRLRTSGDGHTWGVLLAFGPGLTCEALLLRALPPPLQP